LKQTQKLIVVVISTKNVGNSSAAPTLPCGTPCTREDYDTSHRPFY